MVAKVIVDETGNEMITVVVARMPAQMQGVSNCGAGPLERSGSQLRGQKTIGFALIDQQR